MIFVTGDTHGDFKRFSSKNFKQGKELTKDDYVIIAGDFGGIWRTNEFNAQENHELDWLNEKPWTTLFVDGNHENFDRLEAMPEEEKFGSTVGVIRPSILHLKRGNVYEIDGKKFFTFGGGYSIDKIQRQTNVSWWARELPTNEEFKKGLDNLAKHDNKVDFIITHSCSKHDFNMMSLKYHMQHKIADPENQLREYFSLVQQQVDYKAWFCGHFHVNHEVDRTIFLYGHIVQLLEEAE